MKAKAIGEHRPCRGKGCGAPLVWIPRPQTSKWLPVEPEWLYVVPAAEGEPSFAALLGCGEILRRARRWESGEQVLAVAARVIHWSTCPAAAAFKRRKR